MMKPKPFKGLVFLLVLVFLSISFNHAFAQPEYAKWGKTAVEATAEKYPNLDLVNYDYNGKTVISDERAQYDFRFTFKASDGTKKEVLVYVLANPKNNQLIGVELDELGSSS